MGNADSKQGATPWNTPGWHLLICRSTSWLLHNKKKNSDLDLSHTKYHTSNGKKNALPYHQMVYLLSPFRDLNINWVHCVLKDSQWKSITASLAPPSHVALRPCAVHQPTAGESPISLCGKHLSDIWKHQSLQHKSCLSLVLHHQHDCGSSCASMRRHGLGMHWLQWHVHDCCKVSLNQWVAVLCWLVSAPVCVMWGCRR